MSANAVAASEAAPSSAADRIMDAGRAVAHLSHQARLAKSLAGDAIGDGVNAARHAVRSVRRSIERLEDVKDEGIHYVKRQPLKTIAMTAGIGFTVGLMAGWIAGRFSSEPTGKS